MKPNEIIEKNLLMRKVLEYFSKNLKAKSVIIKTDLMGAGKTSWRVTKEGKRFSVVEVRTSKEKFILEAPVGRTTTSSTRRSASCSSATITKKFCTS